MVDYREHFALLEHVAKTYCKNCPDFGDCQYLKKGLVRSCPTLCDVTDGYRMAEKDLTALAQQWVDSGDANVMSFEMYVKNKEENNENNT